MNLLKAGASDMVIAETYSMNENQISFKRAHSRIHHLSESSLL